MTIGDAFTTHIQLLHRRAARDLQEPGRTPAILAFNRFDLNAERPLNPSD